MGYHVHSRVPNIRFCASALGSIFNCFTAIGKNVNVGTPPVMLIKLEDKIVPPQSINQSELSRYFLTLLQFWVLVQFQISLIRSYIVSTL